MTRQLIVVVVAAVALGAAQAGTGGAGTVKVAALAAFPCPANAGEKDTQKWVRTTADRRGSLWCDDGATATVTLNVGQSPLVFKGGVCTSASTGKFISIGTIVYGKRKATDPPGFKTLKWKPSTDTPEAASFSKRGKFDWNDEVKIAWNGLNGSWSGSDGQWIDGKYTVVKASARFACKRIVKTSF
jgi:hypothetical protein